MAILNIPEKSIIKIAIGATLLFIALCLMYFSPAEIPHKTSIPVGLLTITSIVLCPWQIILALGFSAAGDYFGSCGNFIAQMGCFAISHIWYILYFALRYHRKVEHDKKLTARAKGYILMVMFCAACILTTAFLKVVPSVPPGTLRIGVSIYSCLICTMMILAMLQRSSLFALGALLFVFSDFILAWNMFVEPIPHDRLLIMIPYYAAQWLIFIRSSSFKLKHPIRLMRF